MIYGLGGKLAGIKESVGELFTFSKGGFNDLEAGDIGKKIAHGRVGVCPVGIGSLVRVTVLAAVAVLTIRLRYRTHAEGLLLRSVCRVCGMECVSIELN
jgi:hypothetical protein